MKPRLDYDNNAIETGEYFDLGRHSRAVSTSSSKAQIWFDRGLVWSYGFNHEEAVRCFERANKEDNDCAMALWGMAYALGPNYNKPWEIFDDVERKMNVERCRSALSAARVKALASTADVAAIEQSLIEALQYRYGYDGEKWCEDDPVKWNQRYAVEMAKVYSIFAEDLDVAAIYADSLMNVTPWALWDLRTGEAAEGSKTLEAKAVLEKAIEQRAGRQHPGLLHLYTHLMEMSGSPENALPIANRLRGLVPDAGHLHHMPSHLDVLCGEWQRSIATNAEAIAADERYMARAGALNFYSLYRSHNYHFKIYSAMFAGHFRTAIETVAMLEESLPDELLRITSPPMADWLESFLSMRMHVLVRFGRWDEAIALVTPQDSELYCVTAAMVHYAKGVAYAATNRVAESEQQRQLFTEAVTNVPSSRTLFNNTATDILRVAGAMLSGELEYRMGHVEAGLSHLRDAVDFSDSLPYDEPWGWMQPPRHALGALLLEQGRPKDAMQVYKADLGLDDTLPRALRHPNNIWALHGLREALDDLGRAEEMEDLVIQARLDKLMEQTDITISSSCFCRRDDAAWV